MINQRISTELKSHFLRLYQIALSDGEFSTLEVKLLYDFAKNRGVSEDHLNEILLDHSKDISHLIPESIEKKIEHLYDFAIMIWADKEITIDERNSLEKYIKRFGFLDENVEALANYLLDCAQKEKSRLEILSELKG